MLQDGVELLFIVSHPQLSLSGLKPVPVHQ